MGDLLLMLAADGKKFKNNTVITPKNRPATARF